MGKLFGFFFFYFIVSPERTCLFFPFDELERNRGASRLIKKKKKSKNKGERCIKSRFPNSTMGVACSGLRCVRVCSIFFSLQVLS